MASEEQNEINESDVYLAGKFLIAGPSMQDPRFKNSVIYLCAHDAEQAMGIVINKPKPDLKLSSMLPHLNVKGDITFEDTQVLYGGPVEMERGFIIHSRDIMDKENSLPLSDTLALSTSKIILKSLTEDNAPKRAVLALGYAGWQAGQLETEIAANSWMIAPVHDDIIFTGNPDDKWKQALATIGITPALLSAVAGHA